MRIESVKVTDKEIIMSSTPNKLYSHEFEKGRFFQVIFEDEHSSTIKLAPRTMLKIIYIKEKEDIEGFEIIKLIDENETQRIKLSKFNFVQLKEFLKFIENIDLKSITERKLKIFDDNELDDLTIQKIRTLLSNENGGKLIESLINEGFISSKDIVNTSFRKKGLKIFNNFICDSNYWKQYANENEITEKSEEKVLQYFFDKNQWIFGFGLDYKFQQILQKEVNLSDQDLDGKNAVIGDFLLGDKFFTTFVELKRITTPLFKKNKNRSNSWTLSNELINSVSQILEHKAAGLIKLDKSQNIKGELLKQKAYDSKVILIIGSWLEIQNSTSQVTEIKKKTFELFRRDSRNIEIITFDELYERAFFIVNGEI